MKISIKQQQRINDFLNEIMWMNQKQFIAFCKGDEEEFMKCNKSTRHLLSTTWDVLNDIKL